jgi:hypothetical protein
MYSGYFIKKRLSEANPSFDIRYSAVLRFAVHIEPLNPEPRTQNLLHFSLTR